MSPIFTGPLLAPPPLLPLSLPLLVLEQPVSRTGTARAATATARTGRDVERMVGPPVEPPSTAGASGSLVESAGTAWTAPSWNRATGRAASWRRRCRGVVGGVSADELGRPVRRPPERAEVARWSRALPSRSRTRVSLAIQEPVDGAGSCSAHDRPTSCASVRIRLASGCGGNRRV